MIRSLAKFIVVVGMSVAASAQLHPRERFAITTEQVAAKLIATFAQKGVALDARQVSLPTTVLASEASPTLEIRRIEQLGSLHNQPDASVSSAVKLGCANNRVCLPFYAVVTWPQSIPALGASSSFDSGLTAQAPILIKPGARLSLIMEHGTTHLQMSVVSMENGALHRQIKVRTPDRKQTYLAEVVDANTVKGTF